MSHTEYLGKLFGNWVPSKELLGVAEAMFERYGLGADQIRAVIARHRLERRDRNEPDLGTIDKRLQEAMQAGPKDMGVGIGLHAMQARLRDFARSQPDAFRHLCGKAHDECGCPVHFGDAPDCYIQWPETAKWMHHRLDGMAAGGVGPLRNFGEWMEHYRDPFNRRTLTAKELAGLEHLETNKAAKAKLVKATTPTPEEK